ncbi:MAG: 3',5'-cyclic-AMP phosphodiesterase [Methylococcales bacterium]|nr:3',5'-cyclic-AMP phosphodiesterase [Methylococcales bacterium]
MKSPCLSLLQISDIHVLPLPEDKLLGVKTEHYFHAVLADAFTQKSDYDLILLTGDLAQSPCEASYQRILQKIEEYEIPTLCLAGNHDDYPLMQQILNTEHVNCQKQKIVGNWQIIMLNSQIIGSDAGRLEQTELDFLEKCLNQRSDLFTLIAVHHNCLPTNSAWLDTMTIENSQVFLDIVACYPKVRVITNGHIHQEMNKKFGDVSIFGTPSTCFQFALNSADFAMDRTPPGYRTIDLYDDGEVSSIVYRLDTRLNELELQAEGY